MSTPMTRLLSLFAAAILLPTVLVPVHALAANSEQSVQSASLQAVSLRLADVQHVFGKGFTDGGGRYSKTPAIVCPQYPQTSDYTVSFFGPLRTKGVLSVIAQVYKFKSSAGPQCNQKSDIVQQKLLGNTYGKLTKVSGVGDAAFLLDVRTGVKGSPTVYGLTIKFTRGDYRAIILVQSGKTIRPADVMKLGTIVDGRLRHNP